MTLHVPPQLICVAFAGLDVDVTVPLPTPNGLDLSTVNGNVFSVNVAVTVLDAFMVTVQVAPETVSHPTQEVKSELTAGVAVSVTTVPTS